VVEGRYAAYSEALGNVLAAVGYEVEREALLDAPPGSPQSPGGSEGRAAAWSDALSRPAIEGLVGQITFHRSHAPATIDSLHQLHEEVGTDACRFFFLLRSHDQPLDFDLTLAKSRTNENPLYCVQYAHARVASAMKEAKARNIPLDLVTALDELELLDRRTEQTLIMALLCFQDELESAAANCAPHSIVYYLREVANAFHDYHYAETWFVAENDLRNARLALVLAAGQVLRNGLALIGVSAPESM
jgi:arginyl-tRNA synthetase